jgi:hypothetical protein
MDKRLYIKGMRGGDISSNRYGHPTWKILEE